MVPPPPPLWLTLAQFWGLSARQTRQSWAALYRARWADGGGLAHDAGAFRGPGAGAAQSERVWHFLAMNVQPETVVGVIEALISERLLSRQEGTAIEECILGHVGRRRRLGTDERRVAYRPDEERRAYDAGAQASAFWQIADELESQGLTATNSAVYARALGHRGHVVAVMKERRAAAGCGGWGGRGRGAGGRGARRGREPTETPAATIQEDLAQLEHAYEAWHLALERLWQIEQDGPLSEANFARKSWLEYQMVQNLQTQERLRAALARAQVREAVHAAQPSMTRGWTRRVPWRSRPCRPWPRCMTSLRTWGRYFRPGGRLFSAADQGRPSSL